MYWFLKLSYLLNVLRCEIQGVINYFILKYDKPK